MLKLIALEVKKIQLWKYVSGVVIGLCAVSFLSISPPLMVPNETVYQNSQQFLQAAGVLLRVMGTIFTGVLIANIVIKEYESGTILNLFLYPVSKIKLIVSKTLLVVLISFSFLTIAQIILTVLVMFANNMYDLTPGIITQSMVLHNILVETLMLLATIASSMVALFVGLKMKSSVATVVTAIVVSLVVNGNMGTSTSFSSNLILMGIFTGVGIVLVFLSVRNLALHNI